MKNGTKDKHRLVILGSKDEFVELVRLAKDRGIYTICCDGYPEAAAKAVADKQYTIDIHQVDDVAQMCIDEKVDGIITSFSDTLFEQATLIAAKAGLKWYVKPEMLPYYREKDKTKGLLRKLGVKVPKTRCLREDFQEDALQDFVFPVVIKPIDGYGSKGIHIVSSVEEVRQLFSEVVSRGSKDYILAEEYSKGREYNMMTWMSDGDIFPVELCDREKNPFDGKHFPVVNRTVYPAKEYLQSDSILKKAIEVLRKFAVATGQRDGVLSMQFFYDNDQVEVCEIAGRFFGYEHEMVKHWSGLDIEKLLLDYIYSPASARGRMLNYTMDLERFGVALYFVGIQGKKIADLSVCRKLACHPNVVESKIYYEEGEAIDNFGSKPYLARYYIVATSRLEIDTITRKFFSEMYVSAVDGGRADLPFIMEED